VAMPSLVWRWRGRRGRRWCLQSARIPLSTRPRWAGFERCCAPLCLANAESRRPSPTANGSRPMAASRSKRWSDRSQAVCSR
jgi:hypothetical protein